MEFDGANITEATDTWSLDVEPGLVEDQEIHEPDEASDTPRSTTPEDSPPPVERILEGLFFIAAEPLTFERIAQMIRGMTAEQCSESISTINGWYRQQARPYWIERQGEGYRLSLRGHYRGLLTRLHGGIKEVRLSTAAVEALAVVAYRQPITKTGLEAIRGQDCDGPLRQLIRRGLVKIHGQDALQQTLYGTTPRFLEFFRLSKLDELPRADDLDRL